MDFRFTEEQLMLAETIRDYLAGTHGPEVLRRLDADGNRDAALWQGLVDMGLTGLLVPEEFGGLGMGLVDAALIAAECGRACLAEPLVDTAFVGVPWLLDNNLSDDLAEIAQGDRKVALLHPANPWIADLDDATDVICDGQYMGKHDSPGDPLLSVDPLRELFEVGFEQDEADPHLLYLAALMSAAQLLGLADAMLHQAVEYAKIRTQFGQPVGAFQGLKHQLASCAVAIEFAKPVVWRAAAAMQDGTSSAPLHVSHAKVAATDAAMMTAETAIQVHGAMGYTYEVDLHFWMKRTWALAGAWGSRAFHLKRVDEAVLGGAHAIGPEHTFA